MRCEIGVLSFVARQRAALDHELQHCDRLQNLAKDAIHELRRLALVAMAAAAVRFSTPSLA
jgi:hypothetical protein